MKSLLTTLFRYMRFSQGSRRRKAGASRANQRTRPWLEALEDRMVPSTLSIADVTVREGPTTLDVLDPAGATALNLDHPRNIVFNDMPGSSHYHDLFVVSASNNEILRFDWASQTYQLFVAPNSGGLLDPYGATFGSDGNLYVSTGSQSSVLEYDGTTGGFLGTYVTAGAGGLNWAGGLKFASDGNMYVCSWHSNQILKYQGLSIGPNGEQPGQFLGVFANTAHTLPLTYDIGPDSNFYVSCPQLDANGVANQAVIDRYYGPSSPFAGQFIGTFVATGSGGLSQSRTPLFDQQGHLFVADMTLNEVLRYQGPTESNPGAFIDTYVSTGQGGLSAPNGLATGSDGNLYVSSRDANKVTRFAPASQASFAVTLNSSTSNTVTVNYATANGTAVAGTDYTQTNGTLVFAPGVTSQTINVPITTVGTGGPTKTFTMNLSGASGATVSRAQGTGSILNRQTKFFVVDSGTVKTYEYGSGGTSEEITAETSTNTASRGVATTAAGTTVWVVDANKTVYVYDNHGVQLGSWSAGGLSGSAQLTGITTNGTDIWLVDSSADKVYKYAGAASRLLGSQNAVSSFNLVNGHNGNSNPQDIVTDGTSFWVVDGTAHKVFKYSLSGSSLGNWTIDAANAHPTGITINPSNVSDIWIVDNVTLKVYQYTGAAGRTSGSQNASATFALNPYDTNPQGIADPSPADMLLAPINAVSYPTPQFTQLGSPIVLDAHSTAAETSGSWRSLRDDDLVAALQLEPEVRNDVATAAASVPSTGARKTPTLDRLFVDLEDWFTV